MQISVIGTCGKQSPLDTPPVELFRNKNRLYGIFHLIAKTHRVKSDGNRADGGVLDGRIKPTFHR